MSADALNAAPPPTTTTEARSSASAAVPKHRGQKGPAVGFEALLAALTAEQDQTAAALDATGKLAAAGLLAQGAATDKAAAGKDAAGKDAASKDVAAADADAKDSAGDAGKDAAAIVVDASAVAPVVIAPPTVVPQVPVSAAPVPTVDVEVEAPKAEPLMAANTPPPSRAKTANPTPQAAVLAAPVASDDVASADEPAPPADADHEPKAYGLAKLDSGQTIPAAAAAERRADRAEARSVTTPATPPSPAPVKAASGPAPAQPSATDPPEAPVAAPAVEAETAPVLAEAAELAAPPAAKDGIKDSKSPSRYARNEVERSATAQVATGAATSGSAISAKMGDVAQAASDTQRQASAPAPATGGASEEISPAAAQAAEAPEAAPSADLNAATSSTTAPATVTQAAAAQVRGQPQTVANLAAQIIKKLDGRSTRFDVALDPIGLGHVDVRVEIGAEGRMTASMAFDTPQAAAELRGRAGELRTALEQAGFDISGGMSFDVAADGGQSQGSNRQDDQQTPVFRGRAFQTALDTIVDPAPPSAFQYRRSAASGVDIRI